MAAQGPFQVGRYSGSTFCCQRRGQCFLHRVFKGLHGVFSSIFISFVVDDVWSTGGGEPEEENEK